MFNKNYARIYYSKHSTYYIEIILKIVTIEKYFKKYILIYIFNLILNR